MDMTKDKALFYIIIIVVIYLIGAVKIDLMDQDATQYMTIASNMYKSGDFMTITWRGDYNYLDKPPMLFWLSALSFSFLGVSAFAYRLPSILINLLGIFSTYKLGKRLYNEKVGLYSAIIYAGNFGIFVINHDVRTDTMLTGFVIFSIWQLVEFLNDRKRINFILGFVGIGLAISTKGPLGLIIPVLVIGPHLLYKRKWKDIFNPAWLLGIVIIFIVLIPMIISTYSQYGLHGLKFHFWSQSFGRITGESKWSDTTGPFFFLHSFLWSFIPWTIFAVIAYVKKWISVIKTSLPGAEEIMTLSGITLVFIMMSMANYKLPHYIYVVFPLVSIMTASYIQKTFKEEKWEGYGKLLIYSQTGFNLILWLAVIMSFILFRVSSFWIYFITYFAFSYFLYSTTNSVSGLPKIFVSTLITMLGVAFVLNTHFYPSLNPYQGRVLAGKYLKENKIPRNDIMIFPLDVHKPSIDVYSDMLIPRTNNISRIDSLLNYKSSLYVFTNKAGFDSIDTKGYCIENEKTFKDYQISLLSLPFLNPATRKSVLNDLYLVQIEKKDQ
jgi:4-amino-4-deoxy-L-arabinose transferase-like glycosyltransferase